MNHSYRILTCIALLLILSSSITAFAQEDPRFWDAKGVPVRLGDHLEWFGSSAANEYGQTCVTWSDAREGYWDIYAQVIAPNGSRLWTTGGVVVNNSVWRQEDPIVTSVNDGWIIVWLDWRYGDRFHYSENIPQAALFAQKLSLSGELLWTNEGIEVYFAGDTYIYNESIILSHDQQGGAYVGWREYIPNEGYGFKAQHINSTGETDWTDPVIAAVGMGWGSGVKVEQDNAGNMLVVWLAPADSVTTGIFATKLNTNGERLWDDGTNGIRLGSVPGNCYDLDICRDETIDGFFLSWSDRGTGYTDFEYYAQRFDFRGQPLWGESGVLLFDADDGLYGVTITPSFQSGTQDGFLLSGRKTVQSTRFMTVQKVNMNGSLVWGEGGIEVTELSTYLSWEWPKIQTDFAGGCLAVWNREVDDPNSDDVFSHLMIARLNESGQPLWEDNGISIHHQQAYWRYFSLISYVQNSDYVRVLFQDIDNLGYKSISFANGSQVSESSVQIKSMIFGEAYSPVLVTLEDSRVAVVWSDERDGDRTLYVQVVDTLGASLLGTNGVRLTSEDDSLVLPWYPLLDLCADGHGGFFAAAASRYGSNHPVFLYHVSFDESLEHHLTQTLVTDSARGYDDCFRLAPDMNGGCFIAWNRYTPNHDTEAFLQRFNEACEPTWPEPLILPRRYSSRVEALEGTSDNCCIAVHSEEVEDVRDVFAEKINQSGEILWSLVLISGSTDNPTISCESDGSGGMYFCWDNPDMEENPGIYMQHVDAFGTLQWPGVGVFVVDGNDNWEPNLLYHEQSGLYIVWRNSSGLHTQRFDLSGTRLWPEDGIPLANNDYASLQGLSLNGEGGLFSLWSQQNMWGEAFLYGMDLTPEGTPTSSWWTEGTGSVLSTDDRFVNTTRLASFNDGTSLIVWEGQVWGEEKSNSDHAKPNYYYFIDLFAQRIAIGVNTLAADDRPHSLPLTYSLRQNYPNPFNPSTTISFAIPKAGQTSLVVYDLLGRTVETLMNKPLSAGSYHVSWNAGALPSGVYFYRLTAGEFSDVKKTVLLK